MERGGVVMAYYDDWKKRQERKELLDSAVSISVLLCFCWLVYAGATFLIGGDREGFGEKFRKNYLCSCDSLGRSRSLFGSKP